jgi:hypothetical protein
MFPARYRGDRSSVLILASGWLADTHWHFFGRDPVQPGPYRRAVYCGARQW